MLVEKRECPHMHVHTHIVCLYRSPAGLCFVYILYVIVVLRRSLTITNSDWEMFKIRVASHDTKSKKDLSGQGQKVFVSLIAIMYELGSLCVYVRVCPSRAIAN